MFGASASNMDRSLGSVFLAFFFVFFFSSLSPAANAYGDAESTFHSEDDCLHWNCLCIVCIV